MGDGEVRVALTGYGLAGAALHAPLIEAAAPGFRLATIVTAHPEVDHGAVVAGAPSVLDLRGITRRLDAAHVRQL